MADKEQKLIDKFLDATSNLILYWKNVHGYPYSEIKSILDESVRDHVAWVKKTLKDEP
jgi:uncharacterized protein YigE (DUF2233 family)